MLNKIILSAVICALSTTVGFAQAAAEEYKKTSSFQIDYNPIYFDSGFCDQARFGIGIVFN